MSSLSEMEKELWEAVKRGDIQSVTRLLDSKVDINKRYGGFGDTLLIQACWNKQKEMVVLLFSKSVDVNVTNMGGFTALIVSAMFGSEEITDLLLNVKDINVMKGDGSGRTAIHYAAKYNHVNIIERLLWCSVSVDINDNDGRTPLWWAARDGHVCCVDVLLKHGASPQHESERGSPLEIAKRRGRSNVVEMMEEAIRLRSHPYVEGHMFVMKHQYEETISGLQSEVEKMKEELRQSSLVHEGTMLINKIQEKEEEMRYLVSALASRMASEKVGECYTTCAECHMSSQAAGTANQLTPMLVANSRCTEREMVAVADKVRSYWQKFVSFLSPSLFAVDEIRVIELETADLFIQSRRALDKWANHFAAQANRRLIIQTLCDIGRSSQAVDVFGRELVENVCRPK